MSNVARFGPFHLVLAAAFGLCGCSGSPITSPNASGDSVQESGEFAAADLHPEITATSASAETPEGDPTGAVDSPSAESGSHAQDNEDRYPGLDNPNVKASLARDMEI